MKAYRKKNGLTLIEIVTVIAVIAILVSIVITAALRTEEQAKEQLTEGTIAILTAALGQFNDYDYEFKGAYTEHKFPPDGQDTGLLPTLQDSLAAGTVAMTSGNRDPNNSGIESMYFFLNRTVETKKTLEKIDRSLLTYKNSSGTELIIDVDGKKYPLIRVTDAWETALRYEYDTSGTKRTFPLITSAGPDKDFNLTDDNITN